MKKTKLFLVLLLALLPFVGWAQHLNIKLTTGDSISYFYSDHSGSFRPMVKNGKVIWSFNHWIYKINEEEHYRYQDHEEEAFAVDNVESIVEYKNDDVDIRKALIEFYQAMNGDNWFNRDNWCSDKPLNEWYGICAYDNNAGSQSGQVYNLWLGGNNLAGELPKCITQMGPIHELTIGDTNLKGGIPDFLANLYDLDVLDLSNCGLSGDIPEFISKYPYLRRLSLSMNHFDGPLPEKLILDLFDKKEETPSEFSFSLTNNSFSGKVPESIRNHKRFSELWPDILIQDGNMDYSDLTIPAPTGSVKLSDGRVISLEETYQNNKYTLLYVWGWWCSWSELFNQRLIPAYQTYKNKGFEIIGFHEGYEEGLPDYLKTHTIPWANSLQYDWNYNVLLAAFQPQVHLVDQNGNIVFTSHMDEKGNDMRGSLYRDNLFEILEMEFGPIEYDIYTSTDYSKDGEVTTLQTATTGQGIDLVFVGEGFTDKDITDGLFDQRMNEALIQFFAYEPYASLRDRFNVYAVKAVSPNAEFVDGCTHAIDQDVSKSIEYASKVTNLIPNRPMHISVVYNKAGGRSYCVMMEDNSFVCFAMDGVSSVLNHEAGGHGIGKLLDEYVEDGNESLTLPNEDKTELENVWTTLGWGANVDWRSDPTEVKWAKFINDARYADERIGVYEGSYLYQYGAYRPTENSMMRYNDIGFNAPSREEIYKRVMKESEGDNWMYDYETFVAFDAAGHSQFVNALNAGQTRRRGAPTLDRQQLTAPPVFLKGTWRDAMNANKK